eukprot:3868891-Amphidinium_carterae.1
MSENLCWTFGGLVRSNSCKQSLVFSVFNVSSVANLATETFGGEIFSLPGRWLFWKVLPRPSRGVALGLV